MSFRYYEPGVQVGGMLVYEGSRRQRGGNFLHSLKRVFLPIAKRIGRKFGKAGKDLAKRGIKVGVGAVSDRLRGGPQVSLKESLKRRATTAADKALVDYLGAADHPDIPFLSQDGFGIKRRRMGKKSSSKQRKTINKIRKLIKKRKKTKKKKSAKKRDIFSK